MLYFHNTSQKIQKFTTYATTYGGGLRPRPPDLGLYLCSPLRGTAPKAQLPSVCYFPPNLGRLDKSLLTNVCLVTYPAKPTAYIIFFHRNAASALLPLLEPVAITLPSRILILIPIKTHSLTVVCFNFYNQLLAFSHVAFTTVTFL